MSYTWQYYDLVLVAVLLSMVAGVGVGYLTAVAMTTGVVASGLVAAAIIGHGLFVNGPIDDAGDLTDEVDVLN